MEKLLGAMAPMARRMRKGGTLSIGNVVCGLWLPPPLPPPHTHTRTQIDSFQVPIFLFISVGGSLYTYNSFLLYQARSWPSLVDELTQESLAKAHGGEYDVMRLHNEGASQMRKDMARK